jgi:uncharacterized Zn finger protein
MGVEFGATPWGRAWVRTIESTGLAAPNSSLPTARSLARNNAVSLRTAAGRVDADVTASGRTCQVRIDLPTWSGEERATADRCIAKALADNRGLAVGDLPDSLEADLRRENIGVAVPSEDQLSECDCRSWRHPCAHILATIYALSQRIDERPVLAIELRMADAQFNAPADEDWIPLADVDPVVFYGG